MIHITSEGNLFTSFCISVAGTASFYQLAVTALFQFFIQLFFILFNFDSSFSIFLQSLLVLYVVSAIV